MRETRAANCNYNRSLKPLARALRKEMTLAEVRLWKHVLRAGAMDGHRFLRQRPVLSYIADFMCKELRLIIEVDGCSHDTEEVQCEDAQKDQDLEQAGYRVLRVPHRDVLGDLENVRMQIADAIEEIEESSPSQHLRRCAPPPKGDAGHTCSQGFPCAHSEAGGTHTLERE